MSDWITTTEALQLSGYHPDHLRVLLRSRKIHAQKWGRDWQVSRSSLLTYIQKAEATGAKRGPKKSS